MSMVNISTLEFYCILTLEHSYIFIDAVKNAIIYDYNNGLAEGSVNKLKVIKRIMYGRCSFALLRSKILNLEYLKFN